MSFNNSDGASRSASPSAVGPVLVTDHDYSGGPSCGETVELTVWLENLGTSTAYLVHADMSTSDQYVTQYTSAEPADLDIPAGAFGEISGYFLTLSPSTPDGHELVVNFHISDDYGNHWYNSRSEIIYCNSPSASIVYSSHEIDDDNNGNSSGNNNGGVDCGETIEMAIWLRNEDTAWADLVDGNIYGTNDPYLSIIVGESGNPHSMAGGEINRFYPYEFGVSSNTPDGHEIQFQLYISEDGAGEWYDSFVVPVACVSNPPPPANIQASDGTYTDRVSVTWGSVSGATSYRVYRCTSSSTSSCGSAIGSPSSNSFNDTGATPGTTYYYRVAACNSSGCSGYSSYNPGWRAEACYQLARYYNGSGSVPTASPTNSSGCNSGYYHAGQSITMTAHPASGYHLDHWSGTNSSSSNQLTMPASSRTVTAYYVQDALPCYQLTRNYNGSGSAPTASPTSSSGCNSGYYHAGQSITMTPQPATGYHLDYWSGTNSSSSNQLTMPASARTVTAYYAQDAPTVDLSLDTPVPLQVVEGQNFVKGKSTAVKVVVRKSGPDEIKNVSVRLTYGANTFSRFYVAESSNLDSINVLVSDNLSHPLDFPSGDKVKIIYFFSDRLVPYGTSYQVTAEADYLKTIGEVDETNNVEKSTSLTVKDTRWSGLIYPDLYTHYLRVDWGNTPKSAFDSYRRYANEFLLGVLPISSQRFTPGVSTIYTGSTWLFRGLDGKLNQTELGLWALGTLVDMKLAHPSADRFVAVVPKGWFAANTKLTSTVGFAISGGFTTAEAGTSSHPNGSPAATVAHEIGHSYGLAASCEEYDSCNASRVAGVGNLAAPGLWVDKRIPIEIGNGHSYCFMGGDYDVSFWVDKNDYMQLLNDHDALAAHVSNSSAQPQAILAAGILNSNGTAEMRDWYTLSEADLSTLVPGSYMFEYHDSAGQVLHQISFMASVNIQAVELEQSPFALTIPYIPGTAKIVIRNNGVLISEKPISANPPQVMLIDPDNGSKFTDQILIQWIGTDADGDDLSYVIQFSQDSGNTWEALASNITKSNYNWNISEIPSGSQYLIKIIATDGINTHEDISDSPFTINSSRFTYIPLTLGTP